jgi:hypothetical protein
MFSSAVQRYIGVLVAHWDSIAQDGLDSQVVERLLEEIDDLQFGVAPMLRTFLQHQRQKQA